MQESLVTLLNQAHKRAQAQAWPYAGALTPSEAFEIWQHDPEALLVDIRTRAEWEWVGRVPGAIEVEWNTWPGGVPNPNFLGEIQAHIPREARVLLLCRSGARSHNAAIALTIAGYKSTYNILEGFEGDKNEHNQRNQLNGWRAKRLPWEQG